MHNIQKCSNSVVSLFLLKYITSYNIFELQIRFYTAQIDLHSLSRLVPVSESCILKFTFFSLPLFTFWKLWEFPADEEEQENNF